MTGDIVITRGQLSKVIESSSVPSVELHETCRIGLKALGISSLFPVQQVCTDLITKRLQQPQYSVYDCDLCVSAATGQGKTIAYLVPIIHCIENMKLATQGRNSMNRSKARALIVVPTKDLVRQVASVASNFPVTTISLSGEQLMAKEQTALTQGGDIIVSTLGRLLDHLLIGSVDLSQLSWLVVDEADRMLSQSDLDKWESVMDSLPGPPKSVQRLLFSATMTDNPLELNKLKLTRPLSITVLGANTVDEHSPLLATTTHSTLPSTITHRYIVAPNGSMKVRCFLRVLEMVLSAEPSEILPAVKRCLVLCRSNENVNSLLDLLTNLAAKTNTSSILRPCAFSGNLTTSDRERMLEKFASGKINCPVATDVITRGIDIPDIELVINYDVPKHATTYIHRAGRTGRANKPGFVLTVCEKKEVRHFRINIIESSSQLKTAMKKLNMDFKSVMKHGELEMIASNDDSMLKND